MLQPSSYKTTTIRVKEKQKDFLQSLGKAGFRMAATGMLIGASLLKSTPAQATPSSKAMQSAAHSDSLSRAHTLSAPTLHAPLTEQKEKTRDAEPNDTRVGGNIKPDAFPPGWPQWVTQKTKGLLNSTWLSPINTLLTKARDTGKALDNVHQSIAGTIHTHVSEPVAQFASDHPYIVMTCGTVALGAATCLLLPHITSLQSSLTLYKFAREKGLLGMMDKSEVVTNALGDFAINAAQNTMIAQATRLLNYKLWAPIDKAINGKEASPPPPYAKNITIGVTSALLGGLLKPFQFLTPFASYTNIPIYGNLIGSNLYATYRNLRRVGLYSNLFFGAIEEGKFLDFLKNESYELLESTLENRETRSAFL